jgi:hypothetical protein
MDFPRIIFRDLGRNLRRTIKAPLALLLPLDNCGLQTPLPVFRERPNNLVGRRCVVVVHSDLAFVSGKLKNLDAQRRFGLSSAQRVIDGVLVQGVPHRGR